MNDRFPVLVRVLVIVALALGLCAVSGCAARTPSRGPAVGTPVMYEFSSDT